MMNRDLDEHESDALAGDVLAAIAAIPVADTPAERQQLAEALDREEHTRRRRGRISAITAVLSLAAALLLALLSYQRVRMSSAHEGSGATTADASTFEINGERFVSLPYSYGDVTASAARVVEMRVPVSSLMDAGLHVAPAQELVSESSGGVRSSVLADVVLAPDGEPVGIHIISSDR